MLRTVLGTVPTSCRWTHTRRGCDIIYLPAIHRVTLSDDIHDFPRCHFCILLFTRASRHDFLHELESPRVVDYVCVPDCVESALPVRAARHTVIAVERVGDSWGGVTTGVRVDGIVSRRGILGFIIRPGERRA